MNNNELISIIVPVYNAEKYLHRCIKSLLCQTYHNLEVILVDDGSTDKSSEICDVYARKDKRLKVIHKINSGVSAARNTGLALVTGKYVCFVDADDWLPFNSVECLYTQINNTNADIVLGDYSLVLISGAKYKNLLENSITNNIIDLKSFRSILPVAFTPWAKLFRTKIIQSNNITFPEKIGFVEDSFFLYSYLSFCKNIAKLNTSVYFASHLQTSSTSRSYHENTNWCYRIAHEKRLMLFKDISIPPREQSIILETFQVVLKHYINYLPKDLAVLKLEESYNMFKDILNLVSDSDLLSIQNEFVQNYYSYKRYLKTCEYEDLYQYFLNEKKHVNSYKQKIRNIFLPFMQFLVYKLNLFYH